jgi:hypothetical protein
MQPLKCTFKSLESRVVTYTFNPRYLGGRGRKITNLKPTQGKLARSYLEIKIQTKVWEYGSSTKVLLCEALGQSPKMEGGVKLHEYASNKILSENVV